MKRNVIIEIDSNSLECGECTHLIPTVFGLKKCAIYPSKYNLAMTAKFKDTVFEIKVPLRCGECIENEVKYIDNKIYQCLDSSEIIANINENIKELNKIVIRKIVKRRKAPKQNKNIEKIC